MVSGMSAGSVFHSMKAGASEITERAVITSLFRFRTRLKYRIASAGLTLRDSDIVSTETLEDSNETTEDHCLCDRNLAQLRNGAGRHHDEIPSLGLNGRCQKSAMSCGNQRERGYRFRAEVEIVHPA